MKTKTLKEEIELIKSPRVRDKSFGKTGDEKIDMIVELFKKREEEFIKELKEEMFDLIYNDGEYSDFAEMIDKLSGPKLI